jgi:hypothetical protein
MLDVFASLGSDMNPLLTQLAKTRRALFVEGQDFRIIARFASKAGRHAVANAGEFAVVPAQGFDPKKVVDSKRGMELALGRGIIVAAVFDRDYRMDAEIRELKDRLASATKFVHVHDRKELENYLLDPGPIARAVKERMSQRRVGSTEQTFSLADAQAVLSDVTEAMRVSVQGQYMARRVDVEKATSRGEDASTIQSRILREFEDRWSDFQSRMEMVPGKSVLSELNKRLQERYAIALTPAFIIRHFRPEEIPGEMLSLVQSIDEFRRAV